MSLTPEHKLTDWLPTSLKEVKQRGWDDVDVILFTGDAYVDHPSFGAAVIGRVLEREGYKVAIVPQPNWRDDLRDFKKLGKPKLFFGVTSGNMDSMINHYTANLRKRSDDAYTPDAKAGYRPDYAVKIYSNILKILYPDVPVIIGGIETSLRRFTHYDYWLDKLLPGILVDSKADLLVYGMGEKPIIDIASQLKNGIAIDKIHSIPQTAYIQPKIESIAEIVDWETITIASHEEVLKDKEKFAKNFRIIEEESNKILSKRIIQPSGNNLLVVNPPNRPMKESELDAIYDLPYTRLPHPRYQDKGAIPAFEMIKFSINIHRGCFGGCSFCTISAHQGKHIVSRSEKSILNEVEKVIKMPDFKGYISDLGGPSANMFNMKAIDLKICEKCKRPSCIYPDTCKNLSTSHHSLLELYRKVRNHPMIKKATIGSGIRYDLFLKSAANDKSKKDYLLELIKYHVSGRLKVAPEHSSEEVLQLMRKPSFKYFIEFKHLFDAINRQSNLNQQLIPYFISSHPGCRDADMAELAVETKKLNFKPEQVQDFTPTPLTHATAIYYAGIDPYTLKKVYTARKASSKIQQNLFFFWYKKEYRDKIKQILTGSNRKDLIDKLFNR